MPRSREGSFRLFQFDGIEVFLHWSWFLVAAYEIESRKGSYSSIAWNVLEYLALFLIVTLHEFGHALACRQVGGQANRIVLWPLGGIAYVDPPQRAGAQLWSIAAGPLVNVALVPVLLVAVWVGEAGDMASANPNLDALLWTIVKINLVLLVFNVLPIYPLDGGQILRSVLWFVMGRARSLMVAAVIGIVGALGFVGLALAEQSLWYGAIAAFVLMNSWNGLQQARALSRFAKVPRRHEYACPACKTSPPLGEYWKCGQCSNGFDTFQTQAVCPYCSTRSPQTKCFDCGALHPMNEWAGSLVYTGPN